MDTGCLALQLMIDCSCNRDTNKTTNSLMRNQYVLHYMSEKPNHRSQRLALLAFAITACALPLGVNAQSDNFDSGVLSSSWIKMYANPALVSFEFPTVGSGKALRIQAAPFPAAGLPGLAAIMQTNTYSDYYMAVDLVNWAVQDQAFVLCARFQPGGNIGLDGGSGMIMNYDAAQAGDSATSRKGGELQINSIAAGFKTITVAACELTLMPGHSYRVVFQGVGSLYTGQLYDLMDLTAPLATIQATDATYSAGICGILSFSRDNAGVETTDVTLDNYYAGAASPSLATAPALMHPISGTPMVDTRAPAKRWQNFFNPANPITFTAKTYTTNVINAAATKLRLNGLDVSSHLTLSANGASITGSLPGGELKTNGIYSAQIEVTDISGLLSSTNTFWFDTFSDAYLASAAVKVIECEDYNYSSGTFQADPIPVSGVPIDGTPQVNGAGVGYYDSPGAFSTAGTEGVDFHSSQTSISGGWNDYRSNDAVMTGEGIRQEIEDLVHFDAQLPWDPSNPDATYARPNDYTRQKYSVSNLVEYLVIRTHAGDWLNYTRSFTAGSYFALLRAGSFAPTSVTLSQVTSDPTQPNQTTSDFGVFTIPDLVRKSNFSYIPLLDSTGLGAILNLSGATTLRLTMGGATGADDRVEVLNYLLLVPAQVALQSATSVSGPYADDGAATVNTAARTITIPTAGTSKFYRLNAIVPLKIRGISLSGNAATLQY